MLPREVSQNLEVLICCEWKLLFYLPKDHETENLYKREELEIMEG
jgi:hypothetical protein